MEHPLRPSANGRVQARSLDNDARVLAATEAILADGGWGDLSRKAIARRAGTSEQVVRDRAPAAADLAVVLWRRRLGPLVRKRLTTFLTALGLHGDALGPARSDAWHPFVEPDEAWRAIGEMLIVAHVDPHVRAVVGDDLGAALAGWCTPSPTPAAAAQRTFALARALGLVLHGRHGGMTAAGFAPMAEAFGPLLRPSHPSGPLPDERAAHLDDFFPFDSDDPAADATLRCIFIEVGTVGYDRTILTRVAKRAGTDLNFIYRRFGSKMALFQAATLAQRQPSMEINANYRARLAQRYGEGVAEALFIRELLRPGRAVQRACDLEQVRLSWHDPTLAAGILAETEALVAKACAAHEGVPEKLVRAAIHGGRATGMGFVLLADMVPAAWQLDFRVITEPMYGG